MFSEKIRILRKQKQLTQAETAKKIGISWRAYQDLEAGRKPTYDTMLKVADFFDVSVDFLMGRTDNPKVNR